MNKNFTQAILFVLILSISKVEAQMASGMPYYFTVSTAALPSFPSAGMINIILTSPPRQFSETDEWDSLIQPIGWYFPFAGSIYTKFVASSNGWLALMPSSIVTVPATIPNSLPNNALSSNTTGYPIIAPLWDDLSTSVISYLTNANVLWVRWACKWDKNNSAGATPLVYAKLDGMDSTITFYYANNAAYIPTSPSASIGIAGRCIGDFYSVNCTASNSAFVDSVTENANIGTDTSVNFRPYNCSFIFEPYNISDDCSGNQSAKFLGTADSSCLSITGSTINALASGTGCCATSDDNDVWYSFFKPASIADVYIKTSPALCGSVLGTSIEVYDSCGGNLRGCSTTSIIDTGFGELTVSSAAAETLYIRVTSDGDIPGKFQLCVQDLLTASIKNIAAGAAVDFSVYPNPATDKITLTFNGMSNSVFNIKMLDLTGRVISSAIIKNENRKEIDVSNFSKGIYFIQIASEEATISKRVLVE